MGVEEPLKGEKDQRKFAGDRRVGVRRNHRKGRQLASIFEKQTEDSPKKSQEKIKKLGGGLATCFFSGKKGRLLNKLVGGGFSQRKKKEGVGVTRKPHGESEQLCTNSKIADSMREEN